jgi:hypothetical protein
VLRQYDRVERREGEEVRREDVAPAPVDAVLRLQRAAGNQAVARMLAPAGPTVARAIRIGDVGYTHGSRRVVELFNTVVLPELERQGYKARGIKSRLVDFIRDSDVNYGDNRQFLDAFMPWLAQQTRRVRGDKTTSVLKQFSVKAMARPAWPEALKTLKGLQAGDNVRHVVRNATLKNSLDVELKRLPDTARKPRLTEIATGLGIPVAPLATIDVIAKAIYDLLYLNPENLFAGDGPVNQVIGFAADPVRKIGEELVGMGEEEVDIVDVYKAAMAAIHAAADKVRADGNYKQYVLHEIDGTVREAIGSLRQAEDNTKVAAEDAGELVSDIGLGFGFDLIEGRTAGDMNDIAERQGRLLWSERALQGFLDSGGASANVLDIYKVFMGQAPAPTQ